MSNRKLLGVDRASYRYEPRPDRNAELRDELVKLARQKPRYGYRRLHAVLERRGQAVNVKRVYRLYVEQGLAVRRRRRKRLVREQQIEPRLIGANQEWAMDFIVDGLANGRMIRILSVVDAFTRECLVLEADTSLGSGRVTRALDRLIEQRGQPESVRSDNGPEFTSRRMLGWAEERKINLIHIQPGRPMQNGQNPKPHAVRGLRPVLLLTKTHDWRAIVGGPPRQTRKRGIRFATDLRGLRSAGRGA